MITNDYGFDKIDTAIVESSSLFLRTVGDATDIVEKEMYSFKVKGGEELCLRPEVTASVARSYIEHGMNVLLHPVKLWYYGFGNGVSPIDVRKRWPGQRGLLQIG